MGKLAEPIKEAGDRVARAIEPVVLEMLSGVNAKLYQYLTDTIYTIGELPEPRHTVSRVIGLYDEEDGDVCVEYLDSDGDVYEVFLHAELLDNETMQERLRQVVAGVLVGYLNREEPMAVERLHREQALHKVLKTDLVTVEADSTRTIIENKLAASKKVIEQTSRLLKDFDLIKQRILAI